MSREPSALDQVVRHWPRGAYMGADLSMPNVLVRALNKGMHVPAVEIQNAHDHYRAECARDNPSKPTDLRDGWWCESTDRRTSEIGACRPPFNECVMFWRGPVIQNNESVGVSYNACLIETVTIANKDAFHVVTVFTFESNGGPLSMPSGVFTLWSSHATGKTSVSGVLGLGDKSYDEATISLVGARLGDVWAKVLGVGAQGPTWGKDTMMDAMVVMYALAFMNCKNVEMRPRGLTSPPKHWIAQGHRRFRYHVLALVGDRTPGGLRNPRDPSREKRHSLHIVRGHFATYTPEKPLFGKHVGQFWVPQHVRGDEAIGTVVKDYAIGPRN